MLNFLNIEKQAGKRVHRYLFHLASKASIEPASARLVINLNSGRICVHLYLKSKHLETIDLSSIAEFFGKEYDESVAIKVYDYFLQLKAENSLELTKMNIVICENKGEIGAHLYEEAKYKKQIPMIDLITQFYSGE